MARLDSASTADGYADRVDGEKANPLAARRSVAAPGLPQALVRADDQPDRLAGVGPRAAPRRGARARCQRVRGCAPGSRRVPALPPLRATRRRLGRPAAASSHPHRRGRLSRALPRIHPGRVSLRRADHLAAVRRRLSRRHLHRLLRRLVPVVSALACSQGPARGGKLVARGVAQRGADRRTGTRRTPRRRHYGPVRHPRRRCQLSRVGSLAGRDSHRGRASAGDGEAEHVARAARRSRVPRPAPLLAPDLDHDGQLQLLLDAEQLDHHRLRGAGARALPGRNRVDLLPGQRRRARRARSSAGPCRHDSASGRRSSRRPSCSAPP